MAQDRDHDPQQASEHETAPGGQAADGHPSDERRGDRRRQVVMRRRAARRASEGGAPLPDGVRQ